MEVHWFNMTDCMENVPEGEEEEKKKSACAPRPKAYSSYAQLNPAYLCRLCISPTHTYNSHLHETPQQVLVVVNAQNHFYICLPSSRESKAVVFVLWLGDKGERQREKRERERERRRGGGAEEQRGQHSAALQQQSQQMLLLCEAVALFAVTVLSESYLKVLSRWG